MTRLTSPSSKQPSDKTIENNKVTKHEKIANRQNMRKQQTDKTTAKKGKPFFSCKAAKSYRKLNAGRPIGKCRMEVEKHIWGGLAAPLAPITLPADEPRQEAVVPKAEEVQRWMEEMRYYVGLGIFDPSMLLRLQVQHLEYSLGLVINEVLLQDAERTAIDMAEFALSE